MKDVYTLQKDQVQPAMRILYVVRSRKVLLDVQVEVENLETQRDSKILENIFVKNG